MNVYRSHCCCGIPLKLGCFLISFTDLMMSLFLIIQWSVFSLFGILFLADDNGSKHVSGLYELALLMLIVSTILVISNMVLYFGTCVERPRLVLQWTFFQFAYILLHLAHNLGLSYVYFTKHRPIMATCLMLFTFCSIYVRIYFNIIVYSYYRVLRGTAPTSS